MRLIYKLNLKDNIRIYDSMNIESIRQFSEKASFFLQLSTLQRMGMSVVESMQIGLIPIVTKVGEIKYYCSNSNSIEYTSNSAVLNRVFELIKNENDLVEFMMAHEVHHILYRKNKSGTKTSKLDYGKKNLIVKRIIFVGLIIH